MDGGGVMVDPLAAMYPGVSLAHAGCSTCGLLVDPARQLAHLGGLRVGSAIPWRVEGLGGCRATVRRASLLTPPVSAMAFDDGESFAERVTRVRVFSELNNDGLTWHVDGIDTSRMGWRTTLAVESYDSWEAAMVGAASFCDRNGLDFVAHECTRGSHVFDDCGGDTCMACGYVFDDADLADA